MENSNISQAKTITIINNYLKWHNLPINWNETGVCNGLAIVHAHYVLQGKEDIFLKMLHKISRMSEKDFNQSSVSDSPDEDIDHFISQVVLAYKPDLFEKTLSQKDAHKALKIDGNPLDSDFVLPLITTEENWAEILKDMELQPGEVLKIDSTNHAISIHRLNGVYVVFDPNYREGVKKFNSEKELMAELRTNVFEFQDSNMALTFTRITRSGFKHSSSFEQATPEDYTRKYLDLDAIASLDKKTITCAALIARTGNERLMQICLNKDKNKNWSATELKSLGYEAVLNNNNQSIIPILDQLNSCPENTKQEKEAKRSAFFCLILLSIRDGRIELLNKLLENEFGKKVFQSINDEILLNMAARGGNKQLLVDILEKIQTNPAIETLEEDTEDIQSIEDFQNDDTQYEDFETTVLSDLLDTEDEEEVVQSSSLSDFLGEDLFPITQMPEKTRLTQIILQKDNDKENPITLAIKGNSPECLEVLLNKLNQEGYILSEKKQQNYLLLAIRANNVHMVDKLINHMGPEQAANIVGKISLSVELVSKVNIHILKTLEQNGMNFDKPSREIINEKASRKMSVLEIIGAKLVKFLDYIQNALRVDHSEKNKEAPLADPNSLPYAEHISNLKTPPHKDLKAKFNFFKQKHQEQNESTSSQEDTSTISTTLGTSN
ncbi:ankyrin repeat domain-containing protein [Legionella parisiensis]|uniref:Ankyrin repeat-containing protein n=1 Tax=Legionella parisiensis TaxID=45071 RepID=A0A1E5JQR5_9GAMM|nr:ankyrin repeat domain-containing protein [Legionella parisiensis]KTD41564.1 ankyrin repeat-containing protein [Legionella parisiensis]OEH46859.1 hypothetical protein lpari_02060 [Legionella parisiensis]STX76118.1 ankyrin repeat-containing protein [Legionella parisiensis]